jgi:hypothetical protein
MVRDHRFPVAERISPPQPRGVHTQYSKLTEGEPLLGAIEGPAPVIAALGALAFGAFA